MCKTYIDGRGTVSSVFDLDFNAIAITTATTITTTINMRAIIEAMMIMITMLPPSDDST